METYNTRAPDMWSLISKNVDFEGKSVLDLGCGYGDFLLLAHYAGASKIAGVDNNSRIISKVRERIDKKAKNSHIRLYIEDIETLSLKDWDIVLCFSVLPYLNNPDKLLNKIYFNSKIALIEAQYQGEPYCLQNIKNDKDMREWLQSIGWDCITNLGYTDVEIRNAKRTIWRCKVC